MDVLFVVLRWVVYGSWVVVVASIDLGLALGFLYAWEFKLH